MNGKAGIGGILIFLLMLAGAGPAPAGEIQYRFDPITQTSRPLTFTTIYPGYLTFRHLCKSCHYRGNDKGAPFLHTESKTTRGWNRVFVTKYPRCAKDGSWGKLSQDDLLALHDYVNSEAKDTYNPYSTKGSC